MRAYRVLDSAPEPAYDALARLAASICGTPIALVSLIDASRQWFKANVGLEELAETPRAVAFCDHAIRGHELFEVADATRDARFAANPLVVEPPALRFYAGAPLVTPGGETIGTICVMDRRPRELTPLQREQLGLLARLVIGELERRADALRLAEGLAQVARFSGAVLAAPQPESAVGALLDAAAATTRGSAALMRRAADGSYGAVDTLAARPLPGGRAALSEPFRLENAPDAELALPIAGGEPPEWVLIVRGAGGIPAGPERSALELMAAAFATALRNLGLQAEAERRRRQLVAARATQADLVARLARDVRGPVTSIVGYAGMLAGDERLPADAREQLALIRAAGDRVAELAADVELLSRIELAVVEPDPRTIDLVPLALAAGAEIDARGEARVIGDPDLLAAAVGRLVDEGRRAGRSVQARVEDLGEAMVLELSGVGASPVGEGSPATLAGLLARRVAERHGGTLGAQTGRDGWAVRLTLPVERRRVSRAVG